MPIRTLTALAISLPLAGAARHGPQAGARTPDGGLPSDTAARLETVELVSEVFGDTRPLRVLLPPGYDDARDRRHPVLYRLEGQTLFEASDSYTAQAWDVDGTIAGLLREGAIEPLIVVGIDNPGLRGRANEFLPWFDRYLSPPLPDPQGQRFPVFLLTEVMPLIGARYRVLGGAEHTGLGGVSYAGLITLYTILHHPGVFGRALIESPALYVNDAAVLKDAEAFDRWPRKIYLGVGTNEEGREHCDADDMSSEAVQDVLRLATLMEESGLSAERLRLQITICAEHDERAFGSRFPGAMRFLYGSAEGGRVIRRELAGPGAAE